MAYHEIAGSRFYEYRYEDDGKMTGWITCGGGATPDALRDIFAGLPLDENYVEIRIVCHLADDHGVFVGDLIMPIERFGERE